MKNQTVQTVVFDNVAPYPEPVQISELLSEIEAVIKRHVILKDQAAAALAVWALHTYTFELRDTVAYVAIESPEKRCGKTTLLSVLAAMARKPLIASNVTVGALFRAIDTCRPALFIDEADTFLAGNGTMRGIINSGNTWRTAYVLRLARSRRNTDNRQVGPTHEPEDGGTKHLTPALSPSAPCTPSRRGEGSLRTATTLPASWRNLAPDASGVQGVNRSGNSTLFTENGETGLKRYSCWCPKVIAMIGQVPDTISDRSIVVQMSRKLVSETCAPLAELDAVEIRSKCARFALDAAEAIAQSPKIRGEGLNDRAADTFDPLYVIARLAGREWEQKLHAAALALTAAAQSENAGPDILLDVLSVFIMTASDKLFGSDLAELLRGGIMSPALDYSSINEHQISMMLRPYGIRPSAIRMGKEVKRGYTEGDFHDALRRYVPRAELEARLEELRRRVQLQVEAKAEAEAEAKAAADAEAAKEAARLKGKEQEKQPALPKGKGLSMRQMGALMRKFGKDGLNEIDDEVESL